MDQKVTALHRGNDPRWWGNAACAGHDPEWWADKWKRHADAVSICLGCPVSRPCAVDARTRGDVGVVRGGVLFERDGRRRLEISLICESCQVKPTVPSRSGAIRQCVRCRYATRLAG